MSRATRDAIDGFINFIVDCRVHPWTANLLFNLQFPSQQALVIDHSGNSAPAEIANPGGAQFINNGPLIRDILENDAQVSTTSIDMRGKGRIRVDDDEKG